MGTGPSVPESAGPATGVISTPAAIRAATVPAVADFATYYATKCSAAYNAATVAASYVPLCGNKCPAIVGSTSTTRSDTHDSYPVGGGWLFRTDCVNTLTTIANGCVCGWPHSASTAAAGCGRYEGTKNHTQTTAARSCDIDYGYCGVDTGGNCCNSCSYPLKAAAASSTTSSSTTSYSPSTCSDSPSFVSASKVFDSLRFTNLLDDGAEFATAVVMASPNYRQEAATVVQNGPIAVPIKQSKFGSLYASTKDKLYAGNGTTGSQIVNWEEDKVSSCVKGSTVVAAGTSGENPYVYGNISAFDSTGGAVGFGSPTVFTSAATSLSAHDTVYFASCQLPQQIQPCCAGKINCCNVSGTSPTHENASNTCLIQTGGPCTNMTVNPTYNTTGLVYRPYRTYFDVLVGTGGGAAATETFCDGSTGHGGECVFFNGVVQGLASGDQDSSLFAYQPNPFRSPGDTELLRLGVPVSFSLLHSADGTDPASASYIVQMVNNVAVGSTTVGANFQNHRGWKAMGAFWDRLSTAFGTVSSTVQDACFYTGFCKAYFMHAVCTRFLLALYQLAPCCSLDLETQMPIKLFSTSESWTSLVVGALPLMGGTGTFTMLTNAKASTLFTAARPTLKLMSTSGDQSAISVTLIVPSLLFPWIKNNHLGDLLLRMFPRTDAATFALGTTFAPADVFALLTDTGAVLYPPQDVFTVANVVRNFYYTVSSLDPQPKQAATSEAPVPDSTLASAVACSVTFDVLVKSGSLTLLFYLYYLQQVGNVHITAVAGFLADGEPAVDFFPKEIGYTAGCDLLATGQCLRSYKLMYSGVGANNVNALFVSPQCQACKCLLSTDLTAEQQVASGGGTLPRISNAAMCFNVNCVSTANVLVDTPAILLANAASGGTCPPTTAATTTAAVTAAAAAAATAAAAAAAAAAVPYDCSQHCDEFLAGLRTGTVDLSNVNLVNVVKYCDIDIISAVTKATPPTLLWAAGGLAVASMPLLYLVVLAISVAGAARAKLHGSFAQPLAEQPAFFVPCALVCALLCVAFAYYMRDMSGVQTCLAPAVADSDGFTFKQSQCRSQGAFASLGIPAYTLPASFCAASSRYCECDPTSMNMPCSSTGCGCTTTDCCSTVGICTQPSLKATPTVGRPLILRGYTQRVEPAIAAVCAASALFFMPAAVAAAVCGARFSPAFATSPWRLAILGLAVALVVLLACAGPLLYRAFTPALCARQEVGVGACTSLDDYPSNLTLSTDPTVVYTAATTADSAYPVYTRLIAPCACDCAAQTNEGSCTTVCASAAATCSCAWDPNDAGACYSSPPPLISYNAAQQKWQMSAPAGSSTVPVLSNVPGSGVLYQQASTPADGTGTVKPTLFAVFQDAAMSAANTYRFCGQLGTASTCTVIT